MVDWAAFYVGLAVFGIIAILAGIFSKPIDREMARVEEKACGR